MRNRLGGRCVTGVMCGLLMLVWGERISAAEPVVIGTRRELFVDSALIEKISGGAVLRLHEPVAREIVLTHDAPWEGSGCGYHSLFKDGDKYRLYYKAYHLDVGNGKLNDRTHPLYCCYAESRDGIRWTKPNLGLYEFQGSKANNITMASGPVGMLKVDAGHPAVFKDENPEAPASSRYKAFFRSEGPRGLLAFESADGLRWKPMADGPVITDGAFDSQNLAFWDGERKEYRAYWRYFTEGVTTEKQWKPAGIRAIRTARSKNFLHWTDQKDLTYVDSPDEQLYTNQVRGYHRAPHLLIGFPVRYNDRGWSDSIRALPELAHRELRAKAVQRYGTVVTETLLMASRDGVRFQRWNEAFLRPGIEREGTWNYGQQYVAWSPVETVSALEGGAPPELSLYATENYWTGNSSQLRRYTLRLDGFVSASAPRTGGELITKPVVFQGHELRLNFSSSGAGDVRVELQDAEGKPIPGFTLKESTEIFGDALERKVTWKQGGDVAALAGKPVRVRFVLRDADLYAYRFGEESH